MNLSVAAILVPPPSPGFIAKAVGEIYNLIPESRLPGPRRDNHIRSELKMLRVFILRANKQGFRAFACCRDIDDDMIKEMSELL